MKQKKSPRKTSARSRAASSRAKPASSPRKGARAAAKPRSARAAKQVRSAAARKPARSVAEPKPARSLSTKKPALSVAGRKPARSVPTQEPARSAPARKSPRPGRSPNPSDLERPAPNEPVRIQPPAPRFAKRRDSSRNDAAREEDAAPRTVVDHDGDRVQNGVERRRDVERRALDANRWVHPRANLPRGGSFPVHSHPSVRGR